MSTEKPAILKELDNLKGISKRMYDLGEASGGSLHSWSMRPTPGKPTLGVRSGMGDNLYTGGPSAIGVGIYWPIPDPMLDAAIKILQEVKAKQIRLMPPGRTWFPKGQGLERNRYIELISEKLKEENRIDADPQTDILCTSGIAQGMLLVPMMLINPGDEVLSVSPDYVRTKISKVFGGKVINVPLQERLGVLDETRWYFDPAELESRITDKSKLFIFCTPNNPTGYVYSQNDLHTIARIAKQHDLFVLVNECYERMDFRDEFEHTLVFNSLAAVPGMQERTFTIQGLTKAFETEETMFTGWTVGPAEYIDVLKWMQFWLCQKWGTSIGNYMGIAALTKPFRQDYARLRLKDYRWGRDLLWETLKKFPWIECGKAKGGPFMFPDVTGSGMSDVELSKFLNERGVGLGPGGMWGRDGHMRVAYCSPREYQEEMTIQLEQALREYEVIYKNRIKK